MFYGSSCVKEVGRSGYVCSMVAKLMCERKCKKLTLLFATVQANFTVT